MTKKINLKIYGITTVGTKGQIIIPKECREDFLVNYGDDFFIAIFNKIAFGIGEKSFKNMKVDSKNKNFDIQDFGKIKIGTKFQFVIPSEIRKILTIKPGDNLVILGKSNSSKKGLGFIKNNNIDYLLDYIKLMTK